MGWHLGKGALGQGQARLRECGRGRRAAQLPQGRGGKSDLGQRGWALRGLNTGREGEASLSTSDQKEAPGDQMGSQMAGFQAEAREAWGGRAFSAIL